MVDIINIPDGDTNWGTSLRTNLTNLNDGLAKVDPLKTWAQSAFESADAYPPVDDRPIITFGTDYSSSAITSPKTYAFKGVNGGTQVRNWDGQDDPIFRFAPSRLSTAQGGANDLGIYGEMKPGGESQAARWPVIFSFDTSSGVSQVEVAMYSGSANPVFLIEVNGRLVSETLLYRRPVGADPQSGTMLLTFPTAKPRNIRIWADSVAGVSLVRINNGQTLTKPGKPGRRVAIVGDSYVNGSGESYVYPNRGALMYETFAARLVRYLRAEPILAGIGGTGWIAGGTNANYASRTAAVLAMQPDVVIIYGSINDPQDGTGVEAAVTATLQGYSTVARVIVIGPLMSGYEPASAAVKRATLAAGRTFVDMGGFLYGTGTITAQTGDGNNDYFRMTDGAHPNFDGHRAIAYALAQKIMVA